MLLHLLPFVDQEVNRIRQSVSLAVEDDAREYSVFMDRGEGHKTLFKVGEHQSVELSKFIPNPVGKLCSCLEPSMELARAQLETWFRNCPEKDRVALLDRLRSGAETTHVSAFYELVFHEFFIRRNLRVIKEPQILNKKPDFMVVGDDGWFLLEVTAWHDFDTPESRKIIRMFLDFLDKCTDQMILSVEFEALPDPARFVAFRDAVCEWIDALSDAEAPASKRFTLEQSGFQGTIHARMRDGIRTAGAVYEWFPPRSTLSDTELACKRPFDRDFDYIKEVNAPLVVAVGCRDNVALDETTICQKLFGAHEMTSAQHRRGVHLLCREDERFNSERNKRKSAIVFCARRWDRGTMVFDMKVVHNPWARFPLPESAFGSVPQLKPRTASDPTLLEWINLGGSPLDLRFVGTPSDRGFSSVSVDEILESSGLSDLKTSINERHTVDDGVRQSSSSTLDDIVSSLIDVGFAQRRGQRVDSEYVFAAANSLIELSGADCSTHLLETLVAAAETLAHEGEHAYSGEVFECVLERAQERGEIELQLRSLGGLAQSWFYLGDRSRAFKYLDRAVKQAQEHHLYRLERKLEIVLEQLRSGTARFPEHIWPSNANPYGRRSRKSHPPGSD